MRTLALLSTAVSADLRAAAERHRRPMPEYLILERDFGVELLDWTALGLPPGQRGPSRSLRHAYAALRQAKKVDLIFSDGEHIGIPLGLMLQALAIDTPQLMIGHNLLNRHKGRLLRHAVLRPVDRIIVHSRSQIATVLSCTALTPEQLSMVPYGVDTRFWSPQDTRTGVEDTHIVSAGREHRDYSTLVAALPAGVRLTIADHSPFTPSATRRDPGFWPGSVTRVAVDYGQLRDLYSSAAIVAVPLIDSHMPAGITTLLEAMSMGKAVVVADTRELRGVVHHRRTGLIVPPGDVSAMRASLDELLASPALRADLGGRAREVASMRYDVHGYAASLAEHMTRTAELRRAAVLRA